MGNTPSFSENNRNLLLDHQYYTSSIKNGRNGEPSTTTENNQHDFKANFLDKPNEELIDKYDLLRLYSLETSAYHTTCAFADIF